MKGRIAALAVAAVALSFAAGTQAAAGLPLPHKPAAPQVNGRQLLGALLPASDFGSGFVLLSSDNTGTRLLSTKRAVRVSSLSCPDLYDKQIIAALGNTAGADSGRENPSPADWTYPYIVVGFQQVLQFATSASASTYFGQVRAKYAACASFLMPHPASSPDSAKLGGITKTRVNGSPAFWVSLAVGGGEHYIDVLCVLAGTSAYVFSHVAKYDGEPSVTLMTALIHRVQRLYPRA